jgi:SAM-dependent methyltransferase
MSNPYEEKEKNYFAYGRKEILPFLSKGMGTVLEIGCGEGATLELVKRQGYCRTTIGVEYYPEAAAKARGVVDHVFEGDVEHLDLALAENSVDAILCLDVLEHLVEPEKMIQRIHRLLTPGGILVTSIPNVRHYSVSFRLFFLGEWEYKSAGILDRTHLRFYTKRTAIRLVESSGLRVVAVRANVGPKLQILNRLTFGMFNSFVETQYLLKARRAD